MRFTTRPQRRRQDATLIIVTAPSGVLANKHPLWSKVERMFSVRVLRKVSLVMNVRGDRPSELSMRVSTTLSIARVKANISRRKSNRNEESLSAETDIQSAINHVNFYLRN